MPKVVLEIDVEDARATRTALGIVLAQGAYASAETWASWVMVKAFLNYRIKLAEREVAA